MTARRQPVRHPSVSPDPALRQGRDPGSPLAREVLVLNGPNLGQLGARDPEVYGDVDLPALADRGDAWAAARGLAAELRQTDDEAELIGWLVEAIRGRRPVVLNAAAFTHYSYALADAAVQVTQAGIPLL